jgi:hypothetical protein
LREQLPRGRLEAAVEFLEVGVEVIAACPELVNPSMLVGRLVAIEELEREGGAYSSLRA